MIFYSLAQNTVTGFQAASDSCRFCIEIMSHHFILVSFARQEQLFCVQHTTMFSLLLPSFFLITFLSVLCWQMQNMTCLEVIFCLASAHYRYIRLQVLMSAWLPQFVLPCYSWLGKEEPRSAASSGAARVQPAPPSPSFTGTRHPKPAQPRVLSVTHLPRTYEIALWLQLKKTSHFPVL